MTGQRTTTTGDDGARARAGSEAFDPGPVLSALADPTRRAVFGDVVDDGPRTATELAQGRDISRQAVAKHLEVLGRAGLVRSERSGREVRFHAEVDPLEETADWMRRTGDAWDRRLATLQRIVGDQPDTPT